MPQTHTPRDRRITIELSSDAERRLAERAAIRGVSLPEFVSDVVERSAASVSIREISGPVGERFARSGESDEELADYLESEKHQARNERRDHK